MEYEANRILLRGSLARLPAFSHENHGRRFYGFPLEVERLSGAVDRLPVLVAEQVLDEMDLSGGSMLEVEGQIRSYNNRSQTGRKLVISVYAERLQACEGEDENTVTLTGALCREPVYRRTPLGREICDGMLAVNRSYHRADYIPCIFWGRMAQQAAACPVGTALTLGGRLQSRDYVKLLAEGGSEERTAFEVSAMNLEIL